MGRPKKVKAEKEPAYLPVLRDLEGMKIATLDHVKKAAAGIVVLREFQEQVEADFAETLEKSKAALDAVKAQLAGHIMPLENAQLYLRAGIVEYVEKHKVNADDVDHLCLVDGETVVIDDAQAIAKAAVSAKDPTPFECISINTKVVAKLLKGGFKVKGAHLKKNTTVRILK